MTNPIAVSQQRRRILARQICAWAQSTSLSAKDAEDFGCDAIDAFEAEIRADERDAIVAWLRAEAGRMEGDMRADPEGEMAVMYGQRMLYYRQAASSIERGDHLPASVADDSRLDWNIPDNLRWLAEQPNRPPRVPCGYLTGQFLKLCADRWSTHAGEVERLREALKLAANRLARAALDHDVSSSKFLEVSEWGEEARQALEASR